MPNRNSSHTYTSPRSSGNSKQHNGDAYGQYNKNVRGVNSGNYYRGGTFTQHVVYGDGGERIRTVEDRQITLSANQSKDEILTDNNFAFEQAEIQTLVKAVEQEEERDEEDERDIRFLIGQDDQDVKYGDVVEVDQVENEDDDDDDEEDDEDEEADGVEVDDSDNGDEEEDEEEEDDDQEPEPPRQTTQYQNSYNNNHKGGARRY